MDEIETCDVGLLWMNFLGKSLCVLHFFDSFGNFDPEKWREKRDLGFVDLIGAAAVM